MGGDQRYTRVPDNADELIDQLASAPQGNHPVGIDVGTSKIVSAWPHTNRVDTAAQLNAFIPVPYSKFTQRTLDQNAISYFQEGDELVIYGTATEKFANMFNANARRPMSDGLINPKERVAMPVLEAIFEKLVPKASVKGEVLAFSVPAPAPGKEAEQTYHEATLRKYFETRGYRAIGINEGLVVIFAELEAENFTGIGISCGGGMCNVTLAYLSIPSIMFSITKGGDFIDNSVGSVTNEHTTRVKVIKEEQLDLSREPKDPMEKALHIYHDDLVVTLVEALRKAISSAEKLPKTDRPISIVLSGGTAKPRGFRERFDRVLRERRWPIELGPVRLAADPLTATAKGALIAAQYEK